MAKELFFKYQQRRTRIDLNSQQRNKEIRTPGIGGSPPPPHRARSRGARAPRFTRPAFVRLALLVSMSSSFLLYPHVILAVPRRSGAAPVVGLRLRRCPPPGTSPPRHTASHHNISFPRARPAPLAQAHPMPSCHRRRPASGIASARLWRTSRPAPFAPLRLRPHALTPCGGRTTAAHRSSATASRMSAARRALRCALQGVPRSRRWRSLA